MPSTSEPSVSLALPADAPAITRLLNRSYRGESSRQGWTTEADLIAGETRTNTEQVAALIAQPNSVFLVLKAEGEVLGCVNLQQQDQRLYFGMFSVEPGRQGMGLGKRLMQAAEAYARSQGCHSVYMSVISVRTELINWYQRHGYQATGERKPFVEDGISGKHLRPLEFLMLEKMLKPAT